MNTDKPTDDDIIERYIRPAAHAIREDAIYTMTSNGIDRATAERVWKEAIGNIRIFGNIRPTGER